jgi:hypothetical protein
VFRDGVCVLHNGIVVNHEALWEDLSKTRLQEVDTEIIAAIAADYLDKGGDVDGVASRVLDLCKGVVACALALPNLGKLCLFSNNGSLYYGTKNGAYYFASEKYALSRLKCEAVSQVREAGVVIEIPLSKDQPRFHEHVIQTTNLIPSLGTHKAEEAMLEYKSYKLLRCSRCILPETMPYIRFDEAGVCNYCRNYRARNRPRPVEQLFNLVEPFRRQADDDCIVPFSGGRDSCYGPTKY